MIYGYESCSDIERGIGKFTKGAYGRRFSVE
ncbi:transposase [Burkholderia pseudomallei]|nr:transposase [Burkholderia pseudomallei]ARL67548.1 transposase [Burkholderia pseudomallei]